MRAFKTLGWFALAAALAVPAAAASSPVTGTIQVGTIVNTSCKWVSAQSLDFPNYDPADANSTAPLDGTGSITLRCTRQSGVSVMLGLGRYAVAGATCLAPLRQMQGVGHSESSLRYDIYQDAARTHVWGCDATNGQGFTTTTALGDFSLTLYGRIPGGQDVFADSTPYWDLVQVTVSF
jgi:spore coat protein U-like protein